MTLRGTHLAAAYAALALLLAIGPAGCTTAKPKIVTREVRTPIAIRCTAPVASPPAYAAEVVPLEGTIFDLTKALLIEREQRKARELELAAALEGCR